MFIKGLNKDEILYTGWSYRRWLSLLTYALLVGVVQKLLVGAGGILEEQRVIQICVVSTVILGDGRRAENCTDFSTHRNAHSSERPIDWNAIALDSREHPTNSRERPVLWNPVLWNRPVFPRFTNKCLVYYSNTGENQCLTWNLGSC